jgi:hypothetical protein
MAFITPELFIKNAYALFFSTNQNSISDFLRIGIFSPSGVPIFPHRLCRNPFAVFTYGFMNHVLAAAATLARE